MHHKRRSSYETFSIPYGRVCVRMGLTPNVLTAIGVGVTLIAGWALWQQLFFVGVVLMLVAALFDMLDGATARAGNMGTTFGAVLDHSVDRFGEFIILLGISLSGCCGPGWAIFALFGMWSSSYVRAAAESIGKMTTCAVGMLGRLEKFVVLIAGGVFEEFFGGIAMESALILVGSLSFFTAVQRLIFAYRVLNDPESSRNGAVRA